MKGVNVFKKVLSFLPICAFSMATVLLFSGCQLKAGAPVFAGLELDQPLRLPECESMGTDSMDERTATPIPCALVGEGGIAAFGQTMNDSIIFVAPDQLPPGALRNASGIVDDEGRLQGISWIVDESKALNFLNWTYGKPEVKPNGSDGMRYTWRPENGLSIQLISSRWMYGHMTILVVISPRYGMYDFN